MSEGGLPDRNESSPTQTEIFPVVGEPPPPPGAPMEPGRDGYQGPDAGPGHADRQGPEGRFRTGGGGASPISAKSRRIARTLEGHMSAESPWMLGSAALLAALAAYWLDSMLLAFQHSPGMTGQDRLMQLLTPGSFAWAAGVLLAVALHCAGRHFELAPAEAGPLRVHLPDALMAAAIASATCAALDVLVELANLGHGIDRAVAGLLGYAGVIVLAGVTAWWAHRESEASRAA